MDKRKKIKIRRAVRYLYDLQKLRISTGNRDTTEAVELEKADLKFMTEAAKDLKALEKKAEKEIASLIKEVVIWKHYMKDEKGIGPRLAGVIIAEFDIEKAPTISSFWKYAGLAVTNGEADRRRKGQKADYNPWLKSKMTKILSDALIKASPLFKKPKDPLTGKPTEDETQWIPQERTKWRKFYDDYKNRKQNQLVDTCMACNGTGVQKSTEEGETKAKNVKCKNCDGTGGPAPWGKSDGHRDNAAKRYMCKMFLQELWLKWRKFEKLPIREPYAEEYLGRVHHTAIGAK